MYYFPFRIFYIFYFNFFYMKQIEFEYSFENADVQLDRIFDVDLSMYGSSICPENLKKLVIDSSNNKKRVSKKETVFEVMKELSIIPLSLGLVVLAIMAIFIFPGDFLSDLSFEGRVFLGVVVIILVLYFV